MKPNECPICKCQDLEHKTGVSQKNGKAWSGYKCTNKKCGNMVFENSKQAPIRPMQNQSVAQTSDTNEILQEILEELRIMNGGEFKPKVEKKSDLPF